MRVTLRLLLFIGLQLISVSLAAHSDRYDCETKQIVELDDAGYLKNSKLLKFALGDTFFVDQLTGRIQGSVWLNSSGFDKVTIISNDGDFRAVSVGRPPNFATTFVYIKALEKGQGMPFIITDTVLSPWVVSGTCAKGGNG